MLTAFFRRPSGNVVGFGGSDLSVGLLDAYTLKVGCLAPLVSALIGVIYLDIDAPQQPTVTILKAHEFPPTTIAFNPTSSLLASGSPDSVRIVSVPEALGGSCEFLSTSCFSLPLLSALRLLDRVHIVDVISSFVSIIAWGVLLVILLTLLIVLLAIAAQNGVVKLT